MRTISKASTLILTVGILGYGGCSVFTSKDNVITHEAPLSKYNFSYNVVMDQRPAVNQVVFDDGEKTYFKIPKGDYIKKAYKVSDSGYELVDVQQGAPYWSANETGVKWILFTSGGHNIVSHQTERPKNIHAVVNNAPVVKKDTNEKSVSLTKVSVQQRIKQLENKLSSLANVLTKFSGVKPNTKQMLASIKTDDKIDSVNEDKTAKITPPVKIASATPKQVERKANKQDDSIVYIKPQVQMVKVEDSASGQKSVMIKRDGYYSKPLNPAQQQSLAQKSKAMRAEELGEDLSKAEVVTKEVVTKAVQEKPQQDKTENLSENKEVLQGHKQAAVDPVPAQNDSIKLVQNGSIKPVQNESIKPVQNESIKIRAIQPKETTFALAEGQRITQIPFAHGYRVLGPKGKNEIQSIGLDVDSANLYQLTGMATSDGNYDRNQWLAEERAEAVKTALIKTGVAPEKIKLVPRSGEEYGLAVKVSVSYKLKSLAKN